MTDIFSPHGNDVFGNARAESKAGGLGQKFLMSPFTVLSAREGWWQERKRAWLALGIRSEVGRGENLLKFSDSVLLSGEVFKERADNRRRANATASFNDQDKLKDMMSKKGKLADRDYARTFGQDLMRGQHEVGKASPGGDADDEGASASGTSIFDPVLCEVLYRWFSPPGGTIVDPFAGGSVRGVVASKLGRKYIGIDLRPEQIEANIAQGELICDDPVPTWITGDSQNIVELTGGAQADFVFSCPPYADLEVYSDDPRDLSSMEYKDFCVMYSKIIQQACSLLKQDSFACFVVGDVRDKDGFYRNFHSYTIQAFEEAGLRLYNEIILVTSVGSLPVRTGKQFSATRKLGKTHQQAYVFCKGDPRRATEKIGDVSTGEISTAPPKKKGKKAVDAFDMIKAQPKVAAPPPSTGWVMPETFPSLRGRGAIAIDVETYDPELKTRGPGAQRDGYICGIAIGTEDGFRQYYPIRQQAGPNLPPQYVYEWLNEELSTDVPKVGANLLYDLDYLRAAGVEVRGPFHDVQIAEPLLNENRLSYSLETLAQHYLGEGKREDELTAYLSALYGSNIKGNIWRAPSHIVGPYAEGDVDLPLRIFAMQKPLLEAQDLWDLFVMESKLIPMLLAMRQRGVRVDTAKAEALYDLLKVKQDEAIAAIKQASGIAPDIWAADSLAKIFDALGIEYPRTEKTDKPSFRAGWLEKHRHPITGLIRDARNFDKLRETFIKGYILDGHTNGRIHCQFNQLKSDEGGTVSGRFSSSNPNLQNIPVRTKEGKLIREAFIAEEDQLWWKFDWSQIEYRLIAHYAALTKQRGAQAIVDRYNEDRATDYHQAIADLTGLSRADAKGLNFGLAYGQGVDLLCHNLGVDRKEGQEIIDGYHDRAPFIRPLAQMASARANANGEIITLMGRKRRFNVWEKSGQLYQEEVPGARRAFTHSALNSLIQGSAADVMKKAMVEIHESGACAALGAPHLTVHDELDGSLPNTAAGREALAEVQHIMETCVTLKVPLLADGKIGATWAE